MHQYKTDREPLTLNRWTKADCNPLVTEKTCLWMKWMREIYLRSYCISNAQHGNDSCTGKMSWTLEQNLLFAAGYWSFTWIVSQNGSILHLRWILLAARYFSSLPCGQLPSGVNLIYQTCFRIWRACHGGLSTEDILRRGWYWCQMSMMFFAVSSKLSKEHTRIQGLMNWYGLHTGITHLETLRRAIISYKGGSVRKCYCFCYAISLEERNCRTFKPMETNVQGMVVDWIHIIKMTF